MSLRWKYLIVVLSAIIATAAATVVFHRIIYPLDPELAAVGAAFAMVVVVTATMLAAYRSFVERPLRTILHGARRLEEDRDHRIDLFGDDEFAELAASINHLAEQVAESETHLEAQVAERTEDLRAILEEVHERSRIVEEVNFRLADLDRRRMEFLSNVSHDLRTPLNSILGFLKLIDDGIYESEEEKKEFLDNARLSANHLLRMVESVLNATQLEAGRMRLEVGAFHPGDVLHEVARIMEVHARGKSLSIRLEATGSLLVRADESKLRQVLINLVGNAIKFTDEGAVTVRARDSDGRVRFEVEDTGIGIPEGHRCKIFEKFHQVPRAEASQGGTGLGLAIARQLVEMMDGAIEAHSDGPGQGSLFVIDLPAAEPAPVG